jgi:xanthine dehydrogenase accessory factor
MNAQVAITPAAAHPWPEWPDYGLVADLLPVLSQWHQQGLQCALATLIDVQGSAPRPVGSEMAICSDGRVAGYISGGCVEAAVALEAMACIADGQSRYLDYGQDSPILDIQLSCGGRIGILVRPLSDLGDYLARRRSYRERRLPLRMALHRGSGSVRYLDEAQAVEREEVLQVHQVPLRLVAFGADPAVLALVEMAPRFGIDLHVVRPNGPVAAPPGLPLSRYERRRLETALASIRFDDRTAIYSLMHDAGADLQIMQAGLASDAACIGVLGSRSKRAGRLKALRELGATDADLSRLRMPAGQRMAGSSPHVIAMGIIAEAIEAVEQKTSGSRL